MVVQMKTRILSHRELRVYQQAFRLAMEVAEFTRKFPPDERFRMVDQALRCSKSVCAQLGEAWRKRRYRAAFVAKLSDAEGEAAETQVWAEFAVAHRYLTAEEGRYLEEEYEQVIRQIVAMIERADDWILPP